MFKILTLGVLGYLLFKLVFPAPQISETGPQDEEDEWIDYEEVDD